MTDKQKRLQDKAAWDRENTTQIKMKLNNRTDADILERLKHVDGNKQGYIKRLIRQDIENLEDMAKIIENVFDPTADFVISAGTGMTYIEAYCLAWEYIGEHYPDLEMRLKKKTADMAANAYGWTDGAK